MQYRDSIFVSLLKPIDRRHFRGLVARHDGDAYDKSFKSWDHLVALIYTQFSGATSLRGVVAGFNANLHCHYHLGVKEISRSTLSDANARRPVGVFSALFETLSQAVDRQVRREGAEMLRLIDASPIPLGKICDWARWNGRIRGLKMHVVYDPKVDRPCSVEVTPATINDIEMGRRVALETGATYVFDKGYCHYGWWRQIDAAQAVFVTRAKSNMRLRATKRRKPRKIIGDGFRIIDDAEVRLVSKGDSKLAIGLRRIRVRREKGGPITLITNDMTRSAVEIATLYKTRWQIELLFRWIKQHLVIRKFLGNNENAIHLQILGAMIAYLLLRIAARLHGVKIPLLRLAELVGQSLFTRRTIHRIDRPPPVNPSKPQPKTPTNQLAFCYA
jgi:putative transposase